MAKRQLIAFLAGEVDVARITGSIMRGRLPSGVEYLTVRDDELPDIVLVEQWKNPEKKKGDKPPKHSGGKKPYIMLMVDEIEKLRSQGVTNVEELIGYLVCLGKYIEWNTGRLILKRSKKPLRYKDLRETFPCGNKKLNKILAELEDHDLLFKAQDGYSVSGRFIRKGAARDGR